VLATGGAAEGGNVPTYQYACTECGDRSEVVQRFTDDALTVCTACGGKLRKVFSPVGIVFKGSGFYRNDSRDSKTSVSASSSNGSNGSDKKNSPDSSSTSGDSTASKSSDSSTSTEKKADKKKDSSVSAGSAG
jgi:putative FmdB family regulatory protein